MKNAWRVRAMGLVLSVFAVAGCDSTQPDRIETRGGALSMSSIAQVRVWDCYEIWFDNDNDGIPDVDAGAIECFPVLDGTAPDQFQRLVERAVPWRYSLKVTIIPAGGSVEQVAISSDGATVGSSVEPLDPFDDFMSLTDYDPDATPAPPKPNEGNLYYVNGKQVTDGSPIYLSTIGVDPGVPNILDILNPPESFDFNLNTGDTVIVRARKQPQSAQQFLLPGPEAKLRITAALKVSGVAVGTQGATISTIEDGSGFTFSFTVQ